MTEEQINKEFHDLIHQQFAARELDLDKHVINNYRRRDVSLGTKLEVLYRADKLRFKDGWDE